VQKLRSAENSFELFFLTNDHAFASSLIQLFLTHSIYILHDSLEGGRGPEGREQRAEGRGQRAEGRGQRAEGRGERAGGQRAEGGGERAGGQRAEGRGERAGGQRVGVQRGRDTRTIT